MKLFYAEVHFKNSLYPWTIHRKGFTNDLPRLDSDHLFSDRSELELAIQDALKECAVGVVDRVEWEEVDLHACRLCGWEFETQDIMDSGECYPCFDAAGMGEDE